MAKQHQVEVWKYLYPGDGKASVGHRLKLNPGFDGEGIQVSQPAATTDNDGRVLLLKGHTDMNVNYESFYLKDVNGVPYIHRDVDASATFPDTSGTRHECFYILKSQTDIGTAWFPARAVVGHTHEMHAQIAYYRKDTGEQLPSGSVLSQRITLLTAGRDYELGLDTVTFRIGWMDENQTVLEDMTYGRHDNYGALGLVRFVHYVGKDRNNPGRVDFTSVFSHIDPQSKTPAKINHPEINAAFSIARPLPASLSDDFQQQSDNQNIAREIRRFGNRIRRQAHELAEKIERGQV